MKLACIDIGSNSVRMLIVQMVEHRNRVEMKKLQLFRVPIRLGLDVFFSGYISPDKKENLLKTIVAYKSLFDVYGVDEFVVNATSAMRDASNNEEICDYIHKHSGVHINIISGKKEAELIGMNIKQVFPIIKPTEKHYYLDIGGGSTEICSFKGGKIEAHKSFKIGTIRLLQNKTKEQEWEKFKTWTKKHVQNDSETLFLASGGNVNKIYKITPNNQDKILRLEQIEHLYQRLINLSVQQRMEVSGIKKDRAEVIIPAMEILKTFCSTAGNKQFIVPQLGLADGSILSLYSRIKD